MTNIVYDPLESMYGKRGVQQGKKTLLWHDHELTLHGQADGKPIEDAHQSKTCKACALPVFTTPTYICLAYDCDFFIHSKCANLAECIDSNIMELKTYVPKDYESMKCEACRREPDARSYLCINMAEDPKAETPKSFIHFFCAFHHDIGVRHRSHLHNLIVLRSKSYSFWYGPCGACGHERGGPVPDGGNTGQNDQEDSSTGAIGARGQNDQGDSSTAAIAAGGQNDQGDNTAAGQNDQGDSSTAAIAAEGQNDQGDNTAAGQNDQGDSTTAAKKKQEMSADATKAKVAAGDSPSSSASSKLYYVCNICGYWLHEECANLPLAVQHKEHDKTHTLRLNYVPLGASPSCALGCNNEMTSPQAYFCSKCDKYAHITCVTKDKASYDKVSREEQFSGADVKNLPLDADHDSWIVYLEKQSSTTNKSDKHKKSMFRKDLHKHALILTSDKDEDRFCSACVQTIYRSHYRCQRGCAGFFLHADCANLLKPISEQHQYIGSSSKHKFSQKYPLKHRPKGISALTRFTIESMIHKLELVNRPPSDKLLSLFTCRCCDRKSNGLAYICRGCNLTLDVICASLPKRISHGVAHNPSHVLTLQGHAFNPWLYNCNSCNFELPVKSALLPKTAHVESEFDEHPLKLFTSIDDERYSSEEHFCEVCEEKISGWGKYWRNQWYYGCEECNQSFHVDCVPSVSPEFSMVKFGDRIHVDCHSCDIVSIRMLTVGSHRCGECKDIVHGRRDGIAFRCLECAYWMHYKCAEKHWVRKI